MKKNQLSKLIMYQAVLYYEPIPITMSKPAMNEEPMQNTTGWSNTIPQNPPTPEMTEQPQQFINFGLPDEFDLREQLRRAQEGNEELRRNNARLEGIVVMLCEIIYELKQNVSLNNN